MNRLGFVAGVNLAAAAIVAMSVWLAPAAKDVRAAAELRDAKHRLNVATSEMQGARDQLRQARSLAESARDAYKAAQEASLKMAIGALGAKRRYEDAEWMAQETRRLARIAIDATIRLRGTGRPVAPDRVEIIGPGNWIEVVCDSSGPGSGAVKPCPPAGNEAPR